MTGVARTFAVTRHRSWLGRLALPVLLVAVAGCSKPSVPFRPEPVAYADTLPIAEPEEVDPNEVERQLHASVGGQIAHVISLRRWVGAQHEALNVTRFDDVVNSAWFEHRNGRARMTPAEVARGPTGVAPDTSRTLTVIAGKRGGISPGFTVLDENGNVFLLKFDPKGNLQLASAAGVIGNRLFYAAGYHTPEDFIIVFDRSRLQLDPEARIPTDDGKRLMNQADIDSVLASTDPLPDGRFLALASKFVPGTPIGPFLFSGVRKDDPNDYYHHQYRRELRGLYVFSSWLNHVDMRYANTLDVYIDPPGYVRHYLIDFAASLGSGTIRSHKPREGVEYNFDFWRSMARVFSFGFYTAGWEGQESEEIHPTIGWLPMDDFEPSKWRPNWPNAAFNKRTRRDDYWGAKLVASFSDEQIAAAVSQGQLPQPAEDALIRVLIRRRDKIVAYWYSRVTPLENPRVILDTDGDRPTLRLSFEDLALSAGLFEPGQTRYFWRFEDPASRSSAQGEKAAGAGDRQVIELELPKLPAAGREGSPDIFGTLKLKVAHAGALNPEAIVYLRWDGPDVGYTIVGLEH